MMYFMIIGMILLVALSVKCEDRPPININTIMKAIAYEESRDRPLGRHKDGVSFGRYGVTYIAVAELYRVKRIRTKPKDIDLTNDLTNEVVARAYLELLKDRYGSWWSAVKHYNPGDKEYAKRIWARMDIQHRARNPPGKLSR